MRKFLSTILILMLLILSAGCQVSSNTTHFYYPRQEILGGQADGLITSEERDLSEKNTNLQHLLILYLEGPLSQDLRSPFPKGTAITKLDIQEGFLLLTLTDAFSQLEGLERTIAHACLAQTCFRMGDFDAILITSGDKTVTLTPKTISLTDSIAVHNPA